MPSNTQFHLCSRGIRVITIYIKEQLQIRFLMKTKQMALKDVLLQIYVLPH